MPSFAPIRESTSVVASSSTLKRVSYHPATASRNSGRPSVSGYRWFGLSWEASANLSRTWSGVARSGSPIPKLTTRLPSAFLAAIRREISTKRYGGSCWTRWVNFIIIPSKLLVEFTMVQVKNFYCGHSPSKTVSTGPSKKTSPWPSHVIERVPPGSFTSMSLSV